MAAEHDLIGTIFIAGDGAFTYRDRHSRALASVAGTITRMQALEYEEGEDQVYTRAVLQTGQFEAQVEGEAIWSLDVPRVIGPLGGLGHLDHIRLNPTYFAPAQAVITPVAGTDYIANDEQDGSGTDRTSELSDLVPFANYGVGADWALQNNRPVQIWLTKCEVRGTAYLLSRDLRDVVAEAASPAPFAKTYSLRLPWLTDGGDGVNSALAQSFANYVVNHYDESHPKLTVTLNPHTGDAGAQLAQMVGRELGDRVTVTDDSFAYSSQVDGDFFIERIEHRFQTAPGAIAHETKWTLSDFLVDQTWMLGVAGRSELGETTVLGIG
jgi:hypothetical protein